MKLFENFLEEYLKNVKKKLPESFRAKQLKAGGLEAGLVYKFETDFLKEPFLKAVQKTRDMMLEKIGKSLKRLIKDIKNDGQDYTPEELNDLLKEWWKNSAFFDFLEADKEKV
jgi:uncharacterized protein YnzC (UPF0291/DUF896 family)